MASAQLSELESVIERLRDDVLARDQLHEREITEYRLAEAELGERRRNLELALDNAGSTGSELQARCNECQFYLLTTFILLI